MPKHEYIHSYGFASFPTVDLFDIEGMLKFTEAYNVKFIFNVPSQEIGKENVFFIPLEGVIYRISGKNFETIEDYAEAFQNGFINSLDYYEAKKMGFSSYNEYLHCKDMGVKTKDEFMEAKQSGYVKGFESFEQKYDTYKKGKYTSDVPGDIDNPVKLYQYAVSKGFKLYKDLERVLDAGFPEFMIFKDAESKGFKKAEDFYTAVKAGFNDAKEYEEAKKLLIATKKEYEDFRFFRMNAKDWAYDEFQLINILKQYENGTRVPFAELRSKIDLEQEQFKRTFGDNQRYLPIWYSKGIDTDKKMRIFLSENQLLSHLGFFDKETNTFEIFRLSKTKIYIDASNVAFHQPTGETRSAFFRNIKLVVKELKAMGFIGITVIADASLRHKAKDEEYLRDIKKLVTYNEVPANTSADDFLIQSARSERCLIVSNDTFTDWKIKDRWIANNIDFIRQPFLISNDKVIFSGIDKFMKEV